MGCPAGKGPIFSCQCFGQLLDAVVMKASADKVCILTPADYAVALCQICLENEFVVGRCSECFKTEL